MSNAEEEQLDNDLSMLSRTALKNKYQNAYNSWKNRKHSAKADGNWDITFDDFGDFLRIMRAPPSSEHTLDRIDNDNPRYWPGLCRWADKKVQANNRSTTIMLKSEGINKPLTAVATEAGIPPRLMRLHYKRGAFDNSGWTLGERPRDGTLFGKDPHTYKPWPYSNDPKIFDGWERSFLFKGGVEKSTRFEFLFRNLSKLLRDLQTELNSDYGFEDDDVEARQQIIERLKRTLKCEQEAKEQFRLWTQERTIYEAKLYEAEEVRTRKNATYKTGRTYNDQEEE